MAVLYKPGRQPYYTEGESLTEQEHADSCDATKMINNALMGRDVRGGRPPVYGHDDTTLTALDVRIQKQKLEESLAETASNHEFSEEELKHMPRSVAEKFKFKAKPKSDKKTGSKNDESNDDKLGPKTSDDKTAAKTAES